MGAKRGGGAWICVVSALKFQRLSFERNKTLTFLDHATRLRFLDRATHIRLYLPVHKHLQDHFYFSGLPWEVRILWVCHFLIGAIGMLFLSILIDIHPGFILPWMVLPYVWAIHKPLLICIKNGVIWRRSRDVLDLPEGTIITRDGHVLLNTLSAHQRLKAMQHFQTLAPLVQSLLQQGEYLWYLRA